MEADGTTSARFSAAVDASREDWEIIETAEARWRRGGGAGEGNRDNNYLNDNAARLKDIPVHIVHGRFDVVCPMFQADELVAALDRLAGGG